MGRVSKVDFGFSDEGDLVLGDQVVNQEGELLFIDEDNNVTTIESSSTKPLRDMSYAYGNHSEKIVIQNRLKTENPDWYLHPTIGADLSDIIGEPNTKEVGDRGAQLIKRALTYDGYYKQQEVQVRAVPVSLNELLFQVKIFKGIGQTKEWPILFNLETGIVNKYEKRGEVND